MERKQLKHFKQSLNLGLKGFFKPLPLTAVEWADINFYLSAESSYIEGRWQTLPFQVAILNAMGNDEIRTVNLMKSARVGYSQMLKAALAYMLEHKNRNQLLLQPTEASAAGFMKSHIESMIRDVPCIKILAPWYGKKNRDNTIDRKQFSNRRQLWVQGGATAKNYREKSVDTVIYDELAAFPPDVEREGSPTFLGDRRLEGSIFGKSIRGSTPKNAGECQIERAASESGNLLKFEIPCPHCGAFQSLRWGGKDADHGMKWSDNDVLSIGHLCEFCGALGSYAEYMAVMSQGIWRDKSANLETKDGLLWYDLNGAIVPTPESVSFHIWSAYSPFTTWSRLLQDFNKAKKDIGKLKTFVNTILGETWSEQAEKIEHHAIYERREVYHAAVPQGGLVLVCGVDIQDDRIECLVTAYGLDSESWAIDTAIMHGDLSKPRVWQDLDHFLQKEYHHESGAVLRIAATAIDSGGHFTNEVYDFVRHKRHRRIYAIKGKGGAGRPIISRPSTSNKGKIHLYSVGVDTAKELIMSRLKILEYGAGYCHYPIDNKFDEEFFKQLTSEERRTKYIKGRPVAEWVAIRKRNEALDMTVYCLAAKDILNPNLRILNESLNNKESDKKEIKEIKETKKDDEKAAPRTLAKRRPRAKARIKL